MNDPSDTVASSASATLVTSVLPTHPRALEYADSVLPGLIPDESELTARVKIEPGKRYGFFSDTSLCIGCKACEVVCKEWNLLPADGIQISGMSYDNTRRLSATTWRHVTFVEKLLESAGSRVTEMQPFQSCAKSCPTNSIQFKWKNCSSALAGGSTNCAPSESTTPICTASTIRRARPALRQRRTNKGLLTGMLTMAALGMAAVVSFAVGRKR